ncbi:MAG: quinoprotein dehydrogenase-associated putative ABC transporter substrate-binding protein [Methylovirgula sp.]
MSALWPIQSLAESGISDPAAEAAAKGAYADKEFEALSQAEKDAAKQAARTTHFSALRVCADPGNMPLSNQAGEGYENKIAEVLAKSLGAKLSYFWRPYIERGMTRQTFEENECDVLMDVPADYGPVLPTIPIYRTTYVFASLADRHISLKNLDDPQLKKLRVGVFELSALRQALADYGVVGNVHVHEVSHDADLVPEHQPWHQVQDVVDGKLDIAGVWGPFAGWVKTMRGAPLAVQPTNRMDDIVPMEFSMAIGVRTNNAVLKYALDYALRAHQKEIGKILTDYGVPLVQCSECLIAGDIPSHGIYVAPLAAAANLSKPTHWSVSRQTLDQWLADGADINDELANAVLANDVDRAAYLIGKGADVNKLDNQGTPPFVSASRFGCIEMMALLLSHGAKIDGPDRDGWTALLRAVAHNEVAAIGFLLKHGADPQRDAPGGYTPLSIAIEERQFDAANALIEAGVDVNKPASQFRITPLMICASERPAESRARRLLQKFGPMEIAHKLVARGAKVDAANVDGVTALMIAAARDNPAMIGLLIQAGANPHLKSATGETAREIAVKNDNLAAIRTFALLDGQKSTR